jgi:hypothetical protein
MSKIKNILKQLSYYLSIRQTGKTTLLKKGIDEYPYYHWIVVPKLEYAKHMVSPSNKLHNLVTLNTLDRLVGTKQAMIIDQEANLQIFQMAFDEIQKLEDESDKKTTLLHQIVDLTQMYQNDLHNIQLHIMDGFQIPFWNLKQRWIYKKKTIELVKYIIERSEDYSNQFKNIKSYFPLKIKK